MPSHTDIPAPLQEKLAEFYTVTTLPVQWGDQDAFGHVNNVVYFRWFETARIDFMSAVSEGSGVDMRGGGIGPILAAISCSYKKQLLYPDTVYIGTRTGKLGSSSVAVEHSMFSQRQCELIAQATSTIVMFDYDAQRPVRVPDVIRKRLE